MDSGLRRNDVFLAAARRLHPLRAIQLHRQPLRIELHRDGLALPHHAQQARAAAPPRIFPEGFGIGLPHRELRGPGIARAAGGRKRRRRRSRKRLLCTGSEERQQKQ